MNTPYEAEIAQAEQAAAEVARIRELEAQAARLPALKAQAERAERAQALAAELEQIKPVLYEKLQALRNECALARSRRDELQRQAEQQAADLAGLTERIHSAYQTMTHDIAQALRERGYTYEEVAPIEAELGRIWAEATAGQALNTVTELWNHVYPLSIDKLLSHLMGRTPFMTRH